MECVVLNACHSKVQAEKIVSYIPYVIGMSSKMPDDAAINFSIGFYRGIAAGVSIEKSFRLGINMINLDALQGGNVPILLTKPPKYIIEESNVGFELVETATNKRELVQQKGKINVNKFDNFDSFWNEFILC